MFPIYYTTVAGQGLTEAAASGRLALCNNIAKFIPAVLSPILGAIADVRASRKRMLATSLGLGVAAVAGMWFIHAGDIALASWLFIISSVAVSISFVFYESLLPHIAATRDRPGVDRGYAWAYVGGGLCWRITCCGYPGPSVRHGDAGVASRASFVSVAVWWLVFSIPMFRRVREPAAAPSPGGSAIAEPFVSLGRTLRELATRYRQTLLMILAFFIYNDGIMTIITMAASYGASLKFRADVMIASLLLVQFVGIPFAFGFGMLADWIGAKTSVLLGLAAYAGITLFGFFMRTELHFLILAVLVGWCRAGRRRMSRSMFARMVPKHKTGEFFGFFSVFNRFGGMMGTGMFALMALLTDQTRWAILSVVAFFIVGAALLWFVDVEKGERAARAGEAAAR